MVAIRTFLFLVLAIFAHQCHCDDKKEKEKKPEIEFLVKDHIPKSVAVPWVIKGFNNLILGKKNDKLGDVLENQLKSFATVKNIEAMTRDIVEVTDNVHELTTLTAALAELSVLFDKIDHAYNIFLTQKASGNTAKDPSLHSFALETINPYQGPIDYINTIYSRVIPKDLDIANDGVGYVNDLSVLSLLKKHMQTFKRICNKHKSQQQILHMLYLSVGVAQMKVYSILEFCYAKLADIGERDFNVEIASLKDYLYEQSEKAAKMFAHFESLASREVLRCDPAKYIEDETYTELKELFQKYVVNDADMNNEKSCYKTCSDFTHAATTECTPKREYYDVEVDYHEHSICDQQRTCEGNVFDCEDYFAASNELWICPSPLNSTRRYEFMQHGSIDNVLGIHKITQYGKRADKKDCSRNMTYDYRAFGEKIGDDLYRHCETCLCTCHAFKSPNTEQEINVRAIVADNDYVITGARLVKKNRVLHIQIQQGKILPGGRVDESTVHWKPILEPRSVYEKRSFAWNSFRSIYLGYSEIAKDRVVVGLKFSEMKNGNDNMLGIKTLSVPYKYSDGGLSYVGRYYTEPDRVDLRETAFDPLPDYASNPLSNETEVTLVNCDLPPKTEFPSIPSPDSKKFIKLTTSDFKKDLGQSTIPFIDIQDVTTRPAVPIAGISFYHKSREGYGGFLGIKLISFDHSPYIN